MEDKGSRDVKIVAIAAVIIFVILLAPQRPDPAPGLDGGSKLHKHDTEFELHTKVVEAGLPTASTNTVWYASNKVCKALQDLSYDGELDDPRRVEEQIRKVGDKFFKSYTKDQQDKFVKIIIDSNHCPLHEEKEK